MTNNNSVLKLQCLFPHRFVVLTMKKRGNLKARFFTEWNSSYTENRKQIRIYVAYSICI